MTVIKLYIVTIKTWKFGTYIRYRSDRRRPCGLRGGGRGGTTGFADAARDDGHDQTGGHVVQPGRGRSSQRTDRPGDRRIGRSDGTHHRPHDRAIPHAQPFERGRHVESPRAVRQNSLFGGVAPHLGEHDRPLYLAGFRHGTALRTGRGVDLLAKPRNSRFSSTEYFDEYSFHKERNKP